jgi:hypothetical protein
MGLQIIKHDIDVLVTRPRADTVCMGIQGQPTQPDITILIDGWGISEQQDNKIAQKLTEFYASILNIIHS